MAPQCGHSGALHASIMDHQRDRHSGAPRLLRRLPLLAVPVAAVLLLASCSSSTSDSGSGEATTSDSASASTSTAAVGLDTSLFLDGALTEEPTTEDCTLSGGAETTCYRITVSGYPVDHEVGPFCPTTITDGADAGGIWFDGENLYDLDGAFIEGLAETYGDDGWKMYDDEGNVLVTETQERVRGRRPPRRRPRPGEPLHPGQGGVARQRRAHHERGADPHDAGGGGRVATARRPSWVSRSTGCASTPPRRSSDPRRLHDRGVRRLRRPLQPGRGLPPARGSRLLRGRRGRSTGETAQFGYALDGYAVHSPYDDGEAPDDLDACNGHTTDELGYHYHANPASENLVIACLVGQTVESEDGAGGPPGGGAPGDGPPDGADG